MKKIKGWALISEEGILITAKKENIWNRAFPPVRVVPCTIHYKTEEKKNRAKKK